ncbi:MAG: serine hydrolase domain-containing protein [Gaiellaceae bacterium]
MTLDDGAFAATRDGELVVARGPVDEPAVIFSGTKGLVAMCLLLLIERGLLELDAAVSRYWPEFRHPNVLVRHVVSHTSGLPGLRPPPTSADLLDGERMAARLAVEPPIWPAGERLAYHALTFGWLCGELVRRVDGRTVGAFFAEEFAGPLELELWLGLPAEIEPRVARLERAADYGVAGEPGPLLDALYGDLLHEFPWNEPAFHAAEIPAANAIGTARALASLYGRLDTILQRQTIALARTELSRGVCAVTAYPYAFGVGFELQTQLRALGPPANAFGHTGSGGGAHGAWPDARIGFSYLPTKLGNPLTDGRARVHLAELYDDVTDAAPARSSSRNHPPSR